MKERVNFSKYARLHLACTTREKLRPSYGYISFKDGYMYATDGFVLVRCRIKSCCNLIDVDIDKLNGKYIHCDIFKKILSYDHITVEDEGIRCSGGVNDAFFYFSKIENYPSVESMVRSVLSEKRIQTSQLLINPKLFDVAEKCIPHIDGLKFKFVGNSKIDFVIATDMNEVNDCIAIMKPLYHG